MKCIYNLVFITIFFFNFNLLKANELISYVDMDLLMNSSEAGKSISIQLTAIHKKTEVNQHSVFRILPLFSALWRCFICRHHFLLGNERNHYRDQSALNHLYY